MTSRTRKLIGTLILVAWIVVYALVAMAIGGIALADATGWQRFTYYIIAGLAWALPALVLIRWMQRPDKPAEGFD